ncbi:MAG: hypothetical protein AAB198_07425 [Actinomycetota bacterium]
MKRVGLSTVVAALVAAACGGGETTATTSGSTTSTPITVTTTTAATTTVAVTGTWFDGLAAGVCFDDVFLPDGSYDFSVPAAVVPCDGLHDNEVVARVSLGEGAFPADDLAATVTDLCADEYEDFFAVPIEDTAMSSFTLMPDQADWDAGAHDALCMVYGLQPVIGTAASAGLTAPGEVLAMLAIVDDGSQHLLLVDAGSGRVLTDLTAPGAPEPTGVPSWAPDTTALAFAAFVSEGDSDIFLVNPEDGETVVIVEDAGAASSPAIAPTGTAVAYASDIGGEEFEIYVIDFETGTTVILTDNTDRDVSPHWSPDGTRIAFRGRRSGNSDVYVMDADGSNVTQLTSDPAFDGDPRWSPDGSRLLFTSDRGGSFDIWIMNADGTGQTQLTTHPADDEYPTWSSDGRLVAFQTTRHSDTQVWLMRVDGSDQSMLVGTFPTAFPMFAPVPLG